MTLNVTEAENVDNVPKKGKTYVQVLVAIVANTTILTYGFQAGWVSPMTKVLQSENSPSGYPLTDYEISWIASAICLAAMFGVSLFTYIVDKYGRRVAVLLTAALQAVSWILKLSSAHIGVLITARLLAGLGAGGCYNVVPMYVREISQDDIRGVLGSFIILFQNIGIMAMFAMGAYLNYYTVLWIVVWVPVLTILLMLKAPESPAFLVKKGKSDEAAKTIAFLRRLDVNDKTIQSEIEFMKNEEATYDSLPKISFKSIYQNKAWWRGCMLNIILMTIRSNSGNMATLNYAPAIMKSAGVTWNPELQTLSFPAVMILASFISMSCVEKFGRKPLIIIAFAVAVVSHIILATTMLVQHQGSSTPGWLPVVAIITFFAVYAGGISPMPYIIMTEMFNFQIRAKVMGGLVTHAWFMSFVELLSFTAIADYLGTYSVVYIYAGLNLVGVIVGFIFLPETKGKTSEQIENDLVKKK
ncbi:facilitated trehalose transporter Tret1-like isoform X1 [Spodoptera frugiperda]|uniref:Facilitated trehalose transporter Tret1-like isoform X1 n=2 Tax=Spodoptera frugiperda TaxID=7108 RepID=A0A9R0CYC8_SPOFR|nr:facilitated trehalose transporter Tret1-like isoform X1 [Spodoptera frugiperda]